MKLTFRTVFGFSTAFASALLLVVLVHHRVWARENAPDIHVDNTPINRDARLGTSFSPVVKKAQPSVVNIYSTRIVHEQSRMSPLFSDPFFRQFFGNQMQGDDQERTRKEQSLGSGVIVSPDGFILTANHVVAEADEVKVAVNGDKKEYTAKVVGKDSATDVAVLKIDASDLPAIVLGDSDQLEVGDVVLAIGNPFGVGQTVTMGIVSALGRSGFGFSGYENFIQTDAAINPGNSGGALVDIQGRLVGINTAIISRSGGNQGIGFAVPISMARNVMDRLISGGKVTRGYLGIVPQDVTADLAQAFNLPDQNGALVGDISPNTPAQKAGIKSGDIIVAINDKPINDAHALRLTVSDFSPGTVVNVKLYRNGRVKNISVTLEQLPTAPNSQDNDKTGSNDAGTSSTTDALDGVTVQDLDAQAREQLRIPDEVEGVVVTDVNGDSNSADAGIQRNDVLVEINHQAIKNAEQAVTVCKAAKGRRILVKVWHREGNFAATKYFSVDNTKHTK